MSNRAMVWPVLTYRDAASVMTFLQEALGFEVRASYEREGASDVIEHAELGWPSGGGVMISTAGAGSEPFASVPAATGIVYVACDDPDALHDRAVAAGAEIVRELRDEDYGSRDFAVRDPEGVLWSFGTYRGADGGT